ncbi:MAG: NifB/NifX family molybdenum-iron cluster-binding protein [Desulfomicrobiaceae bacterium]
MERRILITTDRNEIAPRFDLAMEVLILRLAEGGEIVARKSLLLAHPSADELCNLILERDMDAVVCGGIEEEYYHYLRWKRVEVFDGVIGSVDAVIDRLRTGTLNPGDIVGFSGAPA